MNPPLAPAVHLNEPTVRHVLGDLAALAALSGLLTAFGVLEDPSWPVPLLGVGFFAIVVVSWPSVRVEYVVMGREIWKRSWFGAWRNREWVVAPLPPDVQLVHKSRFNWEFRPGGPSIEISPWSAPGTLARIRAAGIPVNDWWSEWAGRHRLLSLVGVAIPTIGLGWWLVVLAALLFVPNLRGGSGDPFWPPSFILLMFLVLDSGPWIVRDGPGF